jgi:hypothetical protein
MVVESFVSSALGRPRLTGAAASFAFHFGVERSGASSASDQTDFVDFLFARIGFSHAYDAACLAARCPDQNYHSLFQQSDGDKPLLAILHPVVFNCYRVAVVAAYMGAAWLKQLSPAALSRIISGLLLALGIGLLIEAYVGDAANGLLPDNAIIQIVVGLFFGFIIGSVSSALGVAGGEVIIPTLVFGYGIAIKAAGSLSMIISLPTVLTGLMRHAASGFFNDRKRFMTLILPMGIGSAVGAVIGGLLVGIAPAFALKIALGLLLIWSSWKVLGKH